MPSRYERALGSDDIIIFLTLFAITVTSNFAVKPSKYTVNVCVPGLFLLKPVTVTFSSVNETSLDFPLSYVTRSCPPERSRLSFPSRYSVFVGLVATLTATTVFSMISTSNVAVFPFIVIVKVCVPTFVLSKPDTISGFNSTVSDVPLLKYLVTTPPETSSTSLSSRYVRVAGFVVNSMDETDFASTVTLNVVVNPPYETVITCVPTFVLS